MGSYLVRRFLLMALTLFGMSILIFVMLRLVPGDIAEQILADTAEGVNQIQVRFKARSRDEICDQMAAFGTEVAPAVRRELAAREPTLA